MTGDVPVTFRKLLIVGLNPVLTELLLFIGIITATAVAGMVGMMLTAPDD